MHRGWHDRRGSWHSHVPSNDRRHKSATGVRVVDECADPAPNLVAPVVRVRGGLDGVRVGRPYVGARDLVAVALHEPPKGREASLDGKRRVLVGEVAGGPRQRLGIARRSIYGIWSALCASKSRSSQVARVLASAGAATITGTSSVMV